MFLLYSAHYGRKDMIRINKRDRVRDRFVSAIVVCCCGGVFVEDMDR